MDRRRSNKLSASLAMYHGPVLAPGTGLFNARQDGADWRFDSHESSMELLEQHIDSVVSQLRGQAQRLNRLDDFSASLGGMPAQKLIYKFRKAMDGESMFSIFVWKRAEFLALVPGTLTKKKELFTLTASSQSESWTIDFILVNGKWKIDWIDGYTPGYLK